MNRKNKGWLCVCLVLALALTLPGLTAAAEAPAEALTLSENALFLKTGETGKLSASRGDAVYTVKDESVATVDADGTVRALAHGVTYVTASAQGESAVCGVFVDVLGNDGYVSIEGKSMQPVVSSRELIKWTILQSWDYVPQTGDFYFIQQYDTTPSDDIVTRLQPDGTETYMRLLNSGHGNVLCAEYDEGDVYLWVNANGDVSGAHDSFMRVKWEDGGIVDNDCPYLWKIDGMTHHPSAVVDEETGLALVAVKQGTKMFYRLYDLESLLEGEPALLNSFEHTLGAEDGEMGHWSFQGLCLCGDYIYFLEGGPGTNIYVSVFDLSGELLSMELVRGQENISYREPEGVQVIDGEVYVGIGSGESGNRRANVFVLR